MKLPARILLPIVAALLVTGGLVGFLWWQMTQSELALQRRLQAFGSQAPTASSPLDDTPLDAGDAALVALRQGDLLALHGDWKAAQDQYDAAVKRGGGLPALRKLAQAQLQRRDEDGVRTTMRKMADAGAKPEDVLLIEAILDIRAGDLQKAQTLLGAAPESPQKHYALALIAIVQGSHDDAKQELAQVMDGWDPLLRSYAKVLQGAYDEYALFPDSPNIHLVTLLSRALAETQQCELALPLLAQVSRVQDDYRDAWIVQGFCALTTERYDLALRSLEKAYTLDPEKPETQYYLARAYAATNDHQNAITFAQYALQNGFEPETEVRSFLANQAELAQNIDLALAQYVALSDRKDATLNDTAALTAAALRFQRKEDALLAAEKAVKRWPQDAKAFELLGTILEAIDRKDEAKAAYAQSLQLDPTAQKVREKLGS